MVTTGFSNVHIATYAFESGVVPTAACASWAIGEHEHRYFYQ